MFQLIYVSQCGTDLTPQALRDVAQAASDKNRRLGVSGIVMTHDGVVLQIIEGEESVVRNLYAEISRDPRHSDCDVLLERHCAEREFPEWTLGFCDVDDYGAERFRMTLSALRARQRKRIMDETVAMMNDFLHIEDMDLAS